MIYYLKERIQLSTEIRNIIWLRNFGLTAVGKGHTPKKLISSSACNLHNLHTRSSSFFLVYLPASIFSGRIPIRNGLNKLLFEQEIYFKK